MPRKKKAAPQPTVALAPPSMVGPLRQVSVQEAREICKRPNAMVHWRPEMHLPEQDQYCLTNIQ